MSHYIYSKYYLSNSDEEHKYELRRILKHSLQSMDLVMIANVFKHNPLIFNNFLDSELAIYFCSTFIFENKYHIIEFLHKTSIFKNIPTICRDIYHIVWDYIQLNPSFNVEHQLKLLQSSYSKYNGNPVPPFNYYSWFLNLELAHFKFIYSKCNKTYIKHFRTVIIYIKFFENKTKKHHDIIKYFQFLKFEMSEYTSYLEHLSIKFTTDKIPIDLLKICQQYNPFRYKFIKNKWIIDKKEKDRKYYLLIIHKFNTNPNLLKNLPTDLVRLITTFV